MAIGCPVSPAGPVGSWLVLGNTGPELGTHSAVDEKFFEIGVHEMRFATEEQIVNRQLSWRTSCFVVVNQP
ncbi:MAG: hypothetical protein R8G01_16585 [Ilumatobacteraceae bacterium]|nr:hypothetical protein [Ilumatobacteraceae bacterium]